MASLPKFAPRGLIHLEVAEDVHAVGERLLGPWELPAPPPLLPHVGVPGPRPLAKMPCAELSGWPLKCRADSAGVGRIRACDGLPVEKCGNDIFADEGRLVDP